MKQFSSFVVLFVTTVLFAQSPDLISYQAVVRNSSNELVKDQSVGVKFSIISGSNSGNVVFSETQNTTTNKNGLFSTKIGNGTAIIGSISGIEWENDTFLIKTEIDPAGGTSYTITNTSQLLSVPYALHAKTIANQSVSMAKIKATGTANESTFLRGDGSWVTPASSGGTSLPAQTNNNGKFLTTNGTNLSWANPTAKAPFKVVTVNSNNFTYDVQSSDLGGVILFNFEGRSGILNTFLNLPKPSEVGNGAKFRISYSQYTASGLIIKVKTPEGIFYTGSNNSTNQSYVEVGSTSEFYCDGTNWYEIIML